MRINKTTLSGMVALDWLTAILRPKAIEFIGSQCLQCRIDLSDLLQRWLEPRYRCSRHSIQGSLSGVRSSKACQVRKGSVAWTRAIRESGGKDVKIAFRSEREIEVKISVQLRSDLRTTTE